MTNTQITFRHMDSSPSVEAAIAKEVERLSRHFPALRTCEVVVEAPHQHQRQGQRFHVTLRVRFIDAEVVASRDPGRDAGHEDVYIALRDAFKALGRELERRAGHLLERRA